MWRGRWDLEFKGKVIIYMSWLGEPREAGGQDLLQASAARDGTVREPQ